MYQTINADITHDRMSVAERGVKRFADILCSLVGLIVRLLAYHRADEATRQRPRFLSPRAHRIQRQAVHHH